MRRANRAIISKFIPLEWGLRWRGCFSWSRFPLNCDFVDFFGQISGTLVNAAAVLIGTLIGLGLRGRMSARMTGTVLQALGLLVVTIGIGMSGDAGKVTGSLAPGVILSLIALALGGVIGEALHIEDRLEGLGERLKRRVGASGSFTQGFVVASLLFCVGPLTIIGSIQNGLSGDSRALVIKSALDFISSIALSGAYGIGVGVSVLTVLVLQGVISLGAGGFAALIPDPANDPRVLLVNGAGGVMILGTGVNLLLAGLGLDRYRVRVGSLIPALPLAVLVYYLAVWIAPK